MKNLVIVLALCLSGFATIAQTAAAEAKAAYLLAEESFSAGDWKSTISYLEESKKKIGRPNSKILYLQIMAELEMAKSDPTYNKAALVSIADFEAAPDVKNFNEEKSLEVMKAKIRLNRLQEQAAKDEQAKAERTKWMATLGGTIVTEKDGHGFVMADSDIGKMNFNAGRQACDVLVLNGHDDWRLPTLAEFNQMLMVNDNKKLHSVGFVALGGIYWTSELNGGTLKKKFMEQINNIRPVRTF